MTTVRQLVAQAAAAPDAHRRQVELVRASLRCRRGRRPGKAGASQQRARSL